MAKQSGIHQIKGKIGEHSYYRQTGVSGGLIRSINQGLSARVKADAAYANTRLNNQEFGAAANTAALLGQMVTPKFRPMILPFSQSKMAKEVFRVAREHVANWGQRVVTSEDTQRLCDILSAMSKRDPQEFVSVSVTRTSATEATLSAEFTDAQAILMGSLGINALTVVATQFDLATGQWSATGQIMTTGYLERKDTASVFNNTSVVGVGDSNTEDITVAQFIPASGHSGHQILVFVIMPARTVNADPYILQEYCSFIAMPLPANA